MAELIQDKLYRVSIGSERNFKFIHAKDKEDLIRFLASNYPNRSDIYGAKEILPDGSIQTTALVTDPMFNKLYGREDASKKPLSETLEDVQTRAAQQHTDNKGAAKEAPLERS